jgi:hypothetical protein
MGAEAGAGLAVCTASVRERYPGLEDKVSGKRDSKKLDGMARSAAAAKPQPKPAAGGAADLSTIEDKLEMIGMCLLDLNENIRLLTSNPDKEHFDADNQRLRGALVEAAAWNWLDGDAGSMIPQWLQDEVDAAQQALQPDGGDPTPPTDEG